MNDSPYALRPEAGPMLFDLLNRSQVDALKKIVRALGEGAKEAGKSNESNEDADAVDGDRASRLFFVSGQPGIGKSSLYLTLRAILSNDRRHDKLRETYPADVIPEISSLKGQTRWLEAIDLEVAGEEGENLLAAVLVRISDAIRDSPEGASKKCREAMDQLGELANDIGIAWDGNLKARAGSLDPDSYSQEVMRAQRTRIGTNRRLRGVLDTLLKEKCYAFTGEQLFVLPIDDFYLKPAASLELLRLLRMISVPRLFFLIMGDIKTMEALFFQKALGDWTRVAGPQVFASLRKREKQEILSRVREMKARYIRKLLPPGQRADIDWTVWDESLEFRPPEADGSDSVLKLSHLLSEVDIDWKDEPNKRRHHLLDYLVAPRVARTDENADVEKARALPDPEKGTENRVNMAREAYSGLLILDATPREILDLWMNLNGRKETQGRVTWYLRMVAKFTVAVIEEQDFLTEEQQDRLRFAFPGSDRDNLRVETDRLSLKQKFTPWLSTSSSNIVVRKHFDWQLDVPVDQGSNGVQKKQEVKSLPPRVAAWIILLHDLVLKWNPEGITRNLVWGLLEEITPRLGSPTQEKDQSGEEDPQKNLPNTDDPGWARYKNNGNWVHFPFPKIDTFRQLERFLWIWNSGRENSKSLELENPVLRWEEAAWIATRSEDRYDEFVLTSGQAETDKQGRTTFKRKLFSSHPVLLKALATRRRR